MCVAISQFSNTLLANVFSEISSPAIADRLSVADIIVSLTEDSILPHCRRQSSGRASWSCVSSRCRLIRAFTSGKFPAPSITGQPGGEHRSQLHYFLLVKPLVDLPACVIFGEAIPLLDQTFELISTASDSVQIVIGEIAPFLFDLSFRLFPASFNAVPIHSYSP
jgi:hypothetical protein